MDKPLGVILAGGQAQRMGGGDKGRLALDQHSIMDHVIARLEPQVSALALNANGPADRFDDLGLPVLADSIGAHPGPLAGVLAGLDWAHDRGANVIVTVAADTPFFPRDLVKRLCGQVCDMTHPLGLAATRDDQGKLWRHPTFGIWPVALRDDLRQALSDGVRKVVLWSDRYNARNVLFETAPYDPFFNVNTPADLEQARTMVGAA